MSIDVKEHPAETTSEKELPNRVDGEEQRPSLGSRVGAGISGISWRHVLPAALVMAVLWCSLFLATSWLQVLAGIVPVLGGLWLGRQVKAQYLANGLALGVVGFVMGLLLVSGYAALGAAGIVPLPGVQQEVGGAPMIVTPGELIFFYTTFSLVALIPFPAFGTMMAGRSEQRNRELRQQVAERGGQLERPGAVRTLEDLQGLSLPQLGSFVVNLYRRKGFEFKDYRFIDKDKHLDVELEYNKERYLLRMSVADKVRPGTIESLNQELKRRAIPKGVVIASTEFAPEAVKAIGGRKNMVGIDGQTLFDIAES
jgi:hypothetical protein